KVAFWIETMDHATDRRFGRPVLVEDINPSREHFVHAASQIAVQRLASHDQPFDPRWASVALQYQCEVTRRKLENIDPIVCEYLVENESPVAVAVDDNLIPAN